MLSSRNFRESELIFKSLGHFELIFVTGVRNWSNFTFLHEHLKFFQHPLYWLLCHRLADHISQNFWAILFYDLDMLLCQYHSVYYYCFAV